MLAALDAAEAAGGDIRGRQSAALLVVKAKSTGKPWADKTFDLRIEDHAEPLKELRRLVTMQRAVNHMTAAELAVERKDYEGARRRLAALVPEGVRDGLSLARSDEPAVECGHPARQSGSADHGGEVTG